MVSVDVWKVFFKMNASSYFMCIRDGEGWGEKIKGFAQMVTGYFVMI